MAQTATSAATSRNQIPALHKSVGDRLGPMNLDYGGGKWDTATEWLLEEHGVGNRVYDPYNRTSSHNQAVAARMSENRRMHWDGRADSCTIANVLNVIDCEDEIARVLHSASRMTKPGGAIFISVYEGDRSGRGKKTRDGYQRNARLHRYVSVAEVVWGASNVRLMHGKWIEVRNLLTR